MKAFAKTLKLWRPSSAAPGIFIIALLGLLPAVGSMSFAQHAQGA
jgi:hypothetical protein